jgi:hypothetical protein
LRLDVEHVALTVLAAQRIRIAAGVDEQRLVARGDLRDRQAEAEEISPMMQATLSRSIMRSALVDAVAD